MQLALKRLSPKEAYDRVFRMRRAFQVNTGIYCGNGPNGWLTAAQCSLAHQLLPASEWTKPDQVCMTMM